MELVPTYETDDLDLADRLLRMVADTWAHIHARAGRFATSGFLPASRPNQIMGDCAGRTSLE